MALGGYRSSTVSGLRRSLTGTKGGTNSKGTPKTVGGITQAYLNQVKQPAPYLNQGSNAPLWQQAGMKPPVPVKPVTTPTPTTPVTPTGTGTVPFENRYLIPVVKPPPVGRLGDSQYWADYVGRKHSYDQVVSPLVAQINALYNRRTGGFDAYTKLAGLAKNDWLSATARRNASLAQRGLLRSGTRALSDRGAAADYSKQIDDLSREYGEQRVNELYQQALAHRQGFAGELTALLAGAEARVNERGGTPIDPKKKAAKKPAKKK